MRKYLHISIAVNKCLFFCPAPDGILNLVHPRDQSNSIRVNISPGNDISTVWGCSVV